MDFCAVQKKKKKKKKRKKEKRKIKKKIFKIQHEFSNRCSKHGIYTLPGGVVGWGKSVVCLTSPGVQLIFAYSWARPAILAEGKGRGGMFLFLLFLHFHFFSFLHCPSLFSPLLSPISLLPFSGRRHKMTHKGWLNQINHTLPGDKTGTIHRLMDQ